MDNADSREVKTKKSLRRKVFRSTLQTSLVLGIVMLIIGLSLYTHSLYERYIAESFGLARNASSMIEKVVDIKGISGQVKDYYEYIIENSIETGLVPEEMAVAMEEMEKSRDFRTLKRILKEFRDSSDMSDVYAAFFDPENDSLIYICDPDENPETLFNPGEWETIEHREVLKFINWDGKGKLFDISNTDKYGYMCTSGVPIKNERGDVICFILADVTVNDVFRGMRNFVLQYTVALLILVNIVGYILSRRMGRTLVNPINEIADTAKRYVDDKKKGVTSTEHFSSLDIHTGDEIENLGHVMAEMEHGLNEYEKNLTKITAEKERVSTELSLAARIQTDMLPSKFPAFPEHPELDIYASMDPAKEVGGDFYDFFRIDDDHVGLVIADVSGKGIPAALFMMSIMILLSNSTALGKSPAEVLENTNEAICSHSVEDMFVTVWIGIMEVSTGKIIAANAGHEYPVFRKPGGQFEMICDKHGLVVGGMPGMKYKEYEIQMEPGSKLFVYTDGVPEATNSSNELFGKERMLEALNSDPEAHPEQVLANVKAAVNDFVGDAEQFDDLTMMCIEYKKEEL